jgi:NADH-ubiquinone oxidoreductase chain 3
LYLILDLEILLIFPYTLSEYSNEIYGLIIMIIFVLILTIGFIYELGKGALKIDSKQNANNLEKIYSFNSSYLEKIDYYSQKL